MYIIGPVQWVNVALSSFGATAVGSSTHRGYTPARAIDGIKGGHGWISHLQPLPSINITFNGTFDICYARLMNKFGSYMIKEVELSFKGGSTQRVNIHLSFVSVMHIYKSYQNLDEF